MNTTTLNMTTLDGGVIIKKGGGGGATINNQDKVVDITENGTTEVVADGGYTGLGKVTINTEVSGGESASTIEYLDVRNYDFSQVGKMGIAFSALCSVSSNINTQVDGIKIICPWGLIVQLFGSSAGVNTAIAPKTKAFAIYPEMTISDFSPEGIKIITVVEFLRAILSENGVDYDSIPRITKEEFYDLNA